jgi:prepilin-type N-terminal cleavage/methylation domain-containing protein
VHADNEVVREGLSTDSHRERAMSRRSSGFTLIELMIVVVVIGVLAAIAIPNFVALQMRAREGSTKANMHTLQMGAEDYAVQNNSFYADNVSSLIPLLPGGNPMFKNPFDESFGSGNAWLNSGWANPLTSGSTKAGIVAYADSAAYRYQIVGRGRTQDLTFILSSGQ